MNNGLKGALDQYWTVNPKPRLHRRNTFFNEMKLSNRNALNLGIVATSLAMAIIGMWCLGGFLV